MFERLNPIGLAAAFVLLTCTVIAYAAEPHSGKITAVEKDRIIILDRIDGESEVIMVTAKTKITRKGQEAKLTDLALGDRVKVEADSVKGELVAKSIDAMPAE